MTRNPLNCSLLTCKCKPRRQDLAGDAHLACETNEDGEPVGIPSRRSLSAPLSALGSDLFEQALHPTEKSFRPSHRAAVHGSILQDLSYFGTLEMKGPIDLLKKVLSQCCDPQVPSGSSRHVVLTSFGPNPLRRLTSITQIHFRRPTV